MVNGFLAGFLVARSAGEDARAIPTRDERAPATPPSSPPPEWTVEVPADQSWTDTPTRCRTGYVLEVTATGTIRHTLDKTVEAVGPGGDCN